MVDMTTYPLTKYYCIVERVSFIYRLFILFISSFSFLLFLYTVPWRLYVRTYDTEKGPDLNCPLPHPPTPAAIVFVATRLFSIHNIISLSRMLFITSMFNEAIFRELLLPSSLPRQTLIFER